MPGVFLWPDLSVSINYEDQNEMMQFRDLDDLKAGMKSIILEKFKDDSSTELVLDSKSKIYQTYII
jgi:hypothetical protein